MRQTRLWSAVLLAVAAVVAVPLIGAGPAQADTLICEQFGSTTVGGKYVVQNNRWGSTAEQCIYATGSGFQITSQQGSAPTNGAPLSYPSIYVGCHYTSCSPGTNLPKQVSQIGSANSSISYTYAGGTYDAAYDIWLDPTPKTDGVNQMEIMIWFNRQGSISPVGSPVGNTTVAGRTWEVWQGWNGGNDVVSYVAPSAISGLSFDVMDFVRDVDARTQVTSSWYLTSIQAGFEPWNGGTGLAVTSFSADVTGGVTAGAKEVVGLGSGRCLDVAGGATADGSHVQLWDCNSTGAQKWAGCGSSLVNPQSGKCLDAEGQKTGNGTGVQIYECNGATTQANQVWTLR
jgi:hypothetical protein